jgi:hypothetical protein
MELISDTSPGGYQDPLQGNFAFVSMMTPLKFIRSFIRLLTLGLY